ncbi:MAG TPA: 3-oxoacyl-ACP reductase [Solirubrobacteraceae bacterium]|jgi:3-oxoacyl-[acyl-carrier protein] reductase
MADRYAQIINMPFGKTLAKQLGLPAPSSLRRHLPGRPDLTGSVALGGPQGGRLTQAITQVLLDAHLAIADSAAPDGRSHHALVFDASAIVEPEGLRELHSFFHQGIRAVAPSGRVIVLGTQPEQAGSPAEAIAQRALEGFVRAIGKELRGGATAQLVYVAPGAEQQIASTLRFLLSPRSAYVSGQVIRVGPGEPAPELDWEQPLAGRVALVTGASRGIGAAVAATLARDGAHVVGLDVPALASDLQAVADGLGGSALTLDITSEAAPQDIAKHLHKEHGGVDVVVHNAGITRDKSLANMDGARWSETIDVNLVAVQRITDALLAGASRAALKPQGRVVCVSSISGIAGNAGQTNYATSKAGVIGFVEAYAPLLAERNATVNAVAPGFIETQMTAKMPFPLREAGRRMNSLSQGGLPIDVAETIAWMACPASGGLTGNVVRVCGQSLIGA